jgi:hypothetical protein
LDRFVHLLTPRPISEEVAERLPKSLAINSNRDATVQLVWRQCLPLCNQRVAVNCAFCANGQSRTEEESHGKEHANRC